jgi:hypothetical protein
MTDTDRSFFQEAARDPSFLLARIEADLAVVPVEHLPIITLSPESSKEGYRSVTDGRPRHRVLEAILFGQSDRIHKLICVDGDYCRKKAQHADTVNLMVTVCDSLISAALIFPIPIATVSAYCVRSLFLERLCNCDPEPKTGASGTASH